MVGVALRWSACSVASLSLRELGELVGVGAFVSCERSVRFGASGAGRSPAVQALTPPDALFGRVSPQPPTPRRSRLRLVPNFGEFRCSLLRPSPLSQHRPSANQGTRPCGRIGSRNRELAGQPAGKSALDAFERFTFTLLAFFGFAPDLTRGRVGAAYRAAAALKAPGPAGEADKLAVAARTGE